jgi:hypothetical protein
MIDVTINGMIDENALVKVIANHMKKSYLSWNKDTVKDDVILSTYMNFRMVN